MSLSNFEGHPENYTAEGLTRDMTPHEAREHLKTMPESARGSDLHRALLRAQETQTPLRWPMAVNLHSKTVEQAQRQYEQGYATEVDGDHLAVHRGPLGRLLEGIEDGWTL